ncbi:MAG: T9SS type A sorting domain-containing protein [Calditrichia bacterium]
MEDFSIYQNYPNPFNSTTTFAFELFKPGNVNLTIYNLRGQEIKVLIDKYCLPGKINFKWDHKNLSSGIYFYQIKFGNYSKTKKFIVQN